MEDIFNFSPGPAMLPKPVLTQIQSELNNWNNLGVSIMEISHRSPEFLELVYDTQVNLRSLLNVPENYKILFCHGGARAQFSAIPMNLLCKPSDSIDYVNTGYWGYSALIEAQKFCDPNVINVIHKTNDNSLCFILPMNQWDLSESNVYMHYCFNETVNGVCIDETPNFSDKIVLADCSSMLLSQPLDVNCFGLIYASAQKNLGISGLTVLIIREDLIRSSHYYEIPSILDYRVLSNTFSMFNTPVTISWYVANLVFKWLKKQGGLKIISKYNKEKSTILYSFIDSNDFYQNNIHKQNRSKMNVTFFLKRNDLNNLFLKEAQDIGLYGLKGHKAIGGMRASLYNAMTIEGVEKLVKFMKLFSEKYG